MVNRQRIGIVPGPSPEAGGAFQYTLTMLKALACIEHDRKEDFILLEGNASPVFRKVLRPRRKNVIHLLPRRTWKQQIRHMLKSLLPRKSEILSPVNRGDCFVDSPESAKEAIQDIPIRYNPVLRSWFDRNGIDWCLFTNPVSMGFELDIPYIMPIHDLQHKLQPHFPEFSDPNEIREREYIYKNAARTALCFMVDSEVGKEDVINFYSCEGITPSQIHVLPFLPPDPNRVVSEVGRGRVRKTYNLPDRYFFYPAQFWPHKNHLRLAESLARLHESGHRPMLVVSGSWSEDIRSACHAKFQSRVKELGLQDSVHVLGYIPDADIPPLYAEADALVMPTYFGPTNIPVLEAWQYGCPVITSDLRGIREQVGDAGLLVDPHSSAELASAMERVFSDRDLCLDLIRRGRNRLASYTFEDYCKRLHGILDIASLAYSSYAGEPSTNGSPF